MFAFVFGFVKTQSVEDEGDAVLGFVVYYFGHFDGLSWLSVVVFKGQGLYGWRGWGYLGYPDILRSLRYHSHVRSTLQYHRKCTALISSLYSMSTVLDYYPINNYPHFRIKGVL